MSKLALAVRILLAAVCATPLIILPDTLYPMVVGKALYARTVIEVALALWLPLIVLAPEHRPRRSWILLALFVLLGVSLLAALAGVNPTRSLWSTQERMQGVVNLAHWCAFALMTASMFRTREQWRALLLVNAAVALAVVAVAVYESRAAPEFLRNLNGHNVSSTIGNRLFYASYVCLSIGLTAALLGMCRAWWLRAVLVGALLLEAVMLWVSAQRSGLLAALVMTLAFVIVYALASRRRWVRRSGLGVVVFVALVAGSFAAATWTGLPVPLSDDPMVGRLQSALRGGDASVSGRSAAVQVGVRAFLERPLLGYGPQNFEAAWGRYAHHYRSATHEIFDDAHNYYVGTAASAGAVGLAAFLLLCGLLVRAVVRDVRAATGPTSDDSERRRAALVGATLAAWLFLGFAMLESNVHLLQFILLTAYLTHRDIIHRERRSAAPAPAWRERLCERLRAPGRPDPSRWLGPAGSARRSVRVVGPLSALLVLALAAGMVTHVQILRSAELSVHGDMDAAITAGREAAQAFGPLSVDRYSTLWRGLASNITAVNIDHVARREPQLKADIAAAHAREPANWRMIYHAAGMYLVLSMHRPEYAATAGILLDRLDESAPFYAGQLRRVPIPQ